MYVCISIILVGFLRLIEAQVDQCCFVLAELLFAIARSHVKIMIWFKKSVFNA